MKNLYVLLTFWAVIFGIIVFNQIYKDWPIAFGLTLLCVTSIWCVILISRKILCLDTWDGSIGKTVPPATQIFFEKVPPAVQKELLNFEEKRKLEDQMESETGVPIKTHNEIHDGYTHADSYR
ncbi:MAG TPA: hypothetical protein VJ103_02835 [Candidatus Paceibacterota bacterium]|nr:hypothetical protein [Candidatus Paceibacterota bacterium]